MEHFQDRHSITIWCMLDSSCVIEYDISLETMNSERYCDIVEEKVVPFFYTAQKFNQAVPTRWAHYSRAARDSGQ